jgi:hypothetical protein
MRKKEKSTFITNVIIVLAFILLLGCIGYFVYDREKTREQETVTKCRETATSVEKTQERVYDGPDLSTPGYVGAKFTYAPKEKTVFDENLYKACLQDAGLK